MCTAVSYKTKDHYFGRNMDLEFSYYETVTITPRNYPFRFRNTEDMTPKSDKMMHYAIIGMAYVVKSYPLYYDATNEKGLSVAALNFPNNATYHAVMEGRINIASYELIPWLLCQCESVDEVMELLGKVNITNQNFCEELPVSPLHFMVSDRKRSIVLEPMTTGLMVYDNPVNVLTNNPPFLYHTTNLNNYMSLTTEMPQNHFSEKLPLSQYSRGMGSLGLPGDLSSASRFVRAAFTTLNSVSGESEKESVSQFFHILNSVYQQKGCVKMGNDLYEKTVYSSCMNTDKGIYYYTTYENAQINAIDMHRENLDGEKLISYELIKEQQINYQNIN